MKFQKLKNIVEVKKGKKPSFVEIPDENSVRVLQIDDLRNDTNPKFTNDKTGVLAKEDDVLIAWDGANAGTIGYGKSGYIGSTIALLRNKHPNLYSTTFIGIFLQSQYQYLRSKTTGATIPHISRKALDDLEVPVISVSAQLHIANILSKAENLIAQRKESIRLLDEFLKSIFWEMFGDPVRNEKGWDDFKLGDLINIKHGFAFSSEFFTTTGEYVLLTPGNYHEEGGYRDRGEKQKYYVGVFPCDYLLKKGDLLIAMTEQAAGLLGSAIIIPESNKFLHNQRLGLVQFDSKKLNTQFLYFLFNFNSIRFLIHAKATGIKVRHTSPGRIQEISVGIPPISLQTQFARIVEKTEALKTQYQQSLSELENLFGSLSQKAFRGELTQNKNHVHP